MVFRQGHALLALRRGRLFELLAIYNNDQASRVGHARFGQVQITGVAMSVIDEIRKLGSLLGELASIDLGYPLGENVILPPHPREVVDHKFHSAGLASLNSLREFYRSCNGVKLPDVHVGYFIYALDRIVVTCPHFLYQEL